MRIALIYDLAYPFFVSGATRRIWELGIGLATRGHDVSLLSMHMWEGPREVMRGGVRLVGVCRARPPFNRKGNRSFTQPAFFGLGVLRYLWRHRFDVVDCMEMPYLAALAARLALLRQPAPLVITWNEVRGLRAWREYTGWAGVVAAGLERVVGRIADHNVAVSVLTAERAVQLLGMPQPHLVPNGVDLNAISRVQAPRTNQILHVGRLVRHKQIEWAVEAFKNACATQPDAVLKIIGAGYAKVALTTLVERLDLKTRVVFVQDLNEDELWQEYARSKVLLVPSLQEGFGMAAVEAMAMGTPVIALDTPNSALRTIVTDGQDGVLVQNKDGMTAALQGLLTDQTYWQHLSTGAHNTSRRYAWSGIVDDLERFYQDVVGSRGH